MNNPTTTFEIAGSRVTLSFDPLLPDQIGVEIFPPFSVLSVDDVRAYQDKTFAFMEQCREGRPAA